MPRSAIPTTGPVVTALTVVQSEIYAHGDNEDAGRYAHVNLGFVTLANGEFPGATFTVSAASWSGGFATLTIGAHGITQFQIIGISGIVSTGPGSYNNGGVPIAVSSVPSGTQITYPVTTNPGTYTSGGTVTVGGVTPVDGMVCRKGGVVFVRQGGVFVSLAGLLDPGSNGILLRTGLNTTGVAVAGTDYQAPITNPTWTAPTFANSWANFGGGLTAAGYAKNAVNDLVLRGAIAPGTLSSGYVAIFAALPAGFRPASDRYGTVIGFIGGSNPTPLPIKLDTTGVVSLFNTSFASPSLIDIDCRFPLY